MNTMTPLHLINSPATPAWRRVLVFIAVVLLTVATILGSCFGADPPPASKDSTAGVLAKSTSSTSAGPSFSPNSTPGATERYSYFESLPAFDPLTPLVLTDMVIWPTYQHRRETCWSGPEA